MHLKVFAAASCLAPLCLAAVCLGQLPPPPIPAGNPLTPEKVMLGKILFWEEQLSSDDTTACGTCHQPAFGGSDPRVAQALHPGPDGLYATDDDIQGSLGISRQSANGRFAAAPTFGFHRQVTGRTAPTHMGAAYHIDLFWDMRARTEFVDPETGSTILLFDGALESQAVAPILSPVEMGREGRTWSDVRQKLQGVQPLALARNLPSDVYAALQQNPGYPQLFTAAFGDPAITAVRIAFALASYERTQIPDDTPWDRFMSGDDAAMTTAEQDGWLVFQSSGRCIACHWAPLFTDDLPHVLGLRPQFEDLGVGAISGVDFDNGAFKTPTLRNAGLRPRLFHNGQSPPLGDPAQLTDPRSVLNVYMQGHGADQHDIDPFMVNLQQLGVPVADVQLAIEFVRTALTDERAALRLPPFDHPDLRSMVAPPPRTFGQGLAGAIEPFVIDTSPSYPGNDEWKLGVVAGGSSTLGFLGIGMSSLEPHVPVLGIPLNVLVIGGRWFWMPGGSGQPGHATWNVPLPNDPSLTLHPFYVQLFAYDPQAPFGIAASRGTELTIW